MKNYYSFIIFVILFFAIASIHFYFYRDSIEQKIESSSVALCVSKRCFVTLVWHENEIIASWYDDLPTINDSLVITRKQQGEKILKALQNK